MCNDPSHNWQDMKDSKTTTYSNGVFHLLCIFLGHLKTQNMHFWKWKWRDMWPSMVTHTRNLCSAINPSKVHTHRSEHTHTVNTHPEQWAAIYAAAPGEQLGVQCLAQVYLSRGIEGGERALYIHSPHLQFLPDLRLEL